VSGALGLGERFFASPAERRLVDAIEAALVDVEEGLLAEVGFADDLADVTARYLLDAGGKRVRPTLALLTASLGRGITPEVVRAAQAVELTHLASLYHDDVMDVAPLRRGVPTAQHVWGNSVAILTGDLLFARASSIITSLGDRAIELQARTFERLVLGQLHETIGPREGEDPIAHYLRVLADKTGSLISLAGTVGVIFSDAPDAYRAPIERFGDAVGVAFQLVDDVIDLSAETEQTGKSAGTDLKAGVPTLPLLKLRARAADDAGAAALLERVEAGADETAIAELRAHPVTSETLEEARRWSREAVDAISVLPDGPVRKALTRFAEAVVERTK